MGVVAGGSCSSVAEHWHGKPKALGSIPGSSTFLSGPLPAIPNVYEQRWPEAGEGSGNMPAQSVLHN